MSAILKVTDAAGKVTGLSLKLPSCEAKSFTLTKDVLASHGVDVTKVVRVDLALAPLERAEGYLYIWGFKRGGPAQSAPAANAAP